LAQRPDSPGRGIALMIGAMMLLATMDAVGKHLTATYPVAQILAVRFVMFLALALAIAGRRGVLATLASARPGLQTLRSLILAAEVATFLLAFSLLPLVDVHAVAAVSPLLATALAMPLLGERVGPRRWAAVAAGFAGVLLILRPGLGVFDPLSLLSLGAALLWALYQLLVRVVAVRDAADTTLLYTAIVCALVWGAVAPFVWVAPDLEGWLTIGLAGVLGSVAHLMLIVALRAAPASVLQPFGYTLLVWAAVMGWLVFDHMPDAWTIAGAGIVVASGIYAIRRTRGVQPS